MRSFKALVAVALMVVAVAFLASPAATQVTKVGVCHGTGSDSNPYVFIEVDDNSTQLEAHRAHRDNPPGNHLPDIIENEDGAGEINSLDDCFPEEPPPTTAPPTTEGVAPQAVAPADVVTAQPSFTG